MSPLTWLYLQAACSGQRSSSSTGPSPPKSSSSRAIRPAPSPRTTYVVSPFQYFYSIMIHVSFGIYCELNLRTSLPDNNPGILRRGQPRRDQLRVPRQRHWAALHQPLRQQEMQFKPWFDPTTGYHNYTISWSPCMIV
jgi:hypothetical protein